MLAAYVCPFVLYLVLTSVASKFTGAYPIAYTIAVAIVAVSIIVLHWRLDVIKAHWRIGVAILFGLIGIAIWIVISSARIEVAFTQGLPEWIRPKDRVAYDPFSQLPFLAALGFIAVRFR